VKRVFADTTYVICRLWRMLAGELMSSVA
jgi:hypothetical protein